MDTTPFDVPRGGPVQGAAPGAHPVSSWAVSHADLRKSVSETTFEARGNTTNGTPAPVGSIGLALALRARVVRGL